MRRVGARDRRDAVLAGLVAIALLGALSGFKATGMNNFVWLADAWLHGKPYLVHPHGPYIDAVPYRGHDYVYQAPLPALLLLPLVAIWGLSANQTAVAIVLTGLGIYGAWLVARACGASRPWTALLCAFLLFGTSYAYCGATGDVWFIAHSGAVAFTMLALVECLGACAPWRVALWALCAGFCRYPMMLAIPAYALALAPRIAQRPQSLAPAALVAALFALPSAWYNEIRWGTVVDVGFTKFYRIMDVGRVDPTPPFALRDLPMQLHFYLLARPELIGRAPFLVAGRFGTALTWTSPPLLVALFAPIRERAVQMLWFAAFCCAIPALLYYSRGAVQLGVRHALDFIPFLYALMARAIATRPSPWYLPLFVWSIAFGVVELGVWMRAPQLVP